MIAFDLSGPSATCFVKIDTLEAASACDNRSVAIIPGSVRFTQIYNSIIVAIVIFVVNDVARPFAVVHCPSDTMRSE